MSDLIDLSRNEFLFDHPLLVADCLPRLTAREICQYQAGTKLTTRLSQFHNIDPKFLCLFNGAEQTLKTTFNAVAHMPNTVLLIPSPSWEYYWKLSEAYETKAAPYHYREVGNTFEVDSQGLKETIKNAERVVLLIASPANPLGCRTSDSEIKRLTQIVGEKGHTIIDQTYVGFSRSPEQALSSALEELPSTLFVRSMSKYYGMPGLRVGYVAAQPDVLKAFSIMGDYLGFNAYSDQFSIECINRHAEFAGIAEQAMGERERLREFFSGLPGFKAFQSDTNFILVRVPEREYASYLMTNGIKVRTFPDDKLGDCVRITVPPKGIADRLIHLTSRFCTNSRIAASRPVDVSTQGGCLINAAAK